MRIPLGKKAQSGAPAVERLFTPLRLLLLTTSLVFTVEVLVMFVLPLLPSLTMPAEAMVNGLMLSLIIFPGLHFLLFRPLLVSTTQRRTTELALMESVERFRTLTEAASDAIISTDSHGNVVHWNRAAETVFGHTAEEMVGRSLTVAIPEGFCTNQEAACQQAVTESKPLSPSGPLELLGLRKNGEEFPLELSLSSWDTGDGTFFTGICRDITERRRTEEMLRESKRAAEDANEAKSEFLSRVSHEVRTPVHGTLGMLDLVMDSELSPEQAEYLSLARSSTESLLSIINDILDFSKIGARQLALDEAPFDLRDVLEGAVDLLALRAHGKGLELLCHLPPGVPTALVGDAGRLRQVLVNLLANAVKFTSQGEVVVSVVPVSESDDRVELRFAVRDTGVGIPEDKQVVIFEAFRQADGSTTRAHGGTGLGLTISQELVGLMCGRIEVDSRPDQGSTFHFTCQLAKQAGQTNHGGEVAPEWRRDVRVLVVDGNETGRGILTEQLTDWGIAAVAATDGASALAEFDLAAGELRPFQLVLVDAAMPEDGGFILAERLRDAAGDGITTSDGPAASDGIAIAMMLPSNNVHSDATRCRQLGMPVYLVKPVKQAALLDAVLSAVLPAAERPVTSVPTDTTAGCGPDRPSLRVLLAEDNAAALMIAQKRLEKCGHEVHTAGNGLEAVALVREMEFDLVLMDVEMPEMNGLEATRAIRATESAATGRLPIVAMTAYARQQDRLRCLEAGMDGYLSKPMSDAELQREIERVMANGTGGDTVPSIDIDAALASTDGDSDLLVEVIELFVREDCPRQLVELADGVAREDAGVVRAAAHGIKGAAGYLGGRAITEVAGRLEEMGRNGDLSGAGQTLVELELELARFRESIGLPEPVAVAESVGGA